MKIAYCMHSISGSGGIERIVSYKMNYLAEVLGYEMILITYGQKGSKNFFDLSPKVKNIDLDIDYDKASSDNMLVHSIKKLPIVFRHKRALTKLLYELKLDIIITTGREEKRFLPSIKDGSKKIFEYHFCKYSFIPTSPKGTNRLWVYYMKMKYKRIINSYDKFIVLTNEDKEAWKEIKNIQAIPNFIIKKQEKLPDLSRKRAIAVGRIVPQKGYDRLVNAWAKVNSHHPDWVLHIYGATSDVAYTNYIKSLITTHQLENNLFIHDAVKEIEQEYLDSSVFILSSRYEGFGLVLLEALTNGLSCVSFDCPCGPKDLITNEENGFLVPDGDEEALANRIIELMDDEQLRRKMGEKARLSAQKFHIDHVMKMWNELFLELSAKKNN